MKVQYVISALKAGKNKFTVAQLTDIIRSDAGDAALARRTRRALFVARKAGIVLEPIRDGGKAVSAYQLAGSIPEGALTAAPARKSAKATSTKVAKSAKTVSAKTISKEVNAIVAKNSAPSKKTVAADVKAKNLATIKAVHAKVAQDVHPVTKRKLTDEQKAVRAEFEQMEREAELEEARREERAALRANAPSYLFKESYAE